MNRSDFAANIKPEPVIFFDGDFPWTNVMNHSICNLKVYDVGMGRFAVATESDRNPGASITNGSEALWLHVIKEFGGGVRSMKFFETYDGKNFDGVDIVEGQAKWYSVGSWEKVLEAVR